MHYGDNGTIHSTQYLHIEVDTEGKVVGVWFRCCALPFEATVVGPDRAQGMRQMSKDINARIKLNAVDIDMEDQ